jgi:hypothetical protein
VIRLAPLTPEDLFVLLSKLVHVHAAGDRNAYLLPPDGLHAFMSHCASKVGEAYFRTPRNTIRSFLDLLAILEQNRDQRWDQIIGTVPVTRESNPDLEPLPDETPAGVPSAGRVFGDEDDELASFRL